MAAVTPASTYTNLGPGAHHTSQSHTIFEGMQFFTLQFHFVPTRLTKKPKLRPNLAQTSLASDPREQGHNYPKPVISDLGHTAHTQHSTCSSVGGETMFSLGPGLRCLLVYLHLRIRAWNKGSRRIKNHEEGPFKGMIRFKNLCYPTCTYDLYVSNPNLHFCTYRG